jgi:GMP synthase (glutamine-hydrolysing)
VLLAFAMGMLAVLKHDDRIGPGWLLDRCTARCDSLRVKTIKTVEDLPPPNLCSGVVLACHSIDLEELLARDKLLREQLVFIRTLIGLGVPYLGIDGGAQLLARAMGGQVLEARRETLGQAAMVLTEAGRDDPLLGGLGPELPVIRWPTHSIALPPKRAVLLAGTPDAPDAFSFGEWTYGILPHLEATPLMFSEWLETLPGEIENVESLIASVEKGQEEQQCAAFNVMNRFLDKTDTFCFCNE